MANLVIERESVCVCVYDVYMLVCVWVGVWLLVCVYNNDTLFNITQIDIYYFINPDIYH